jgi:hypothetical protein
MRRPCASWISTSTETRIFVALVTLAVMVVVLPRGTLAGAARADVVKLGAACADPL